MDTWPLTEEQQKAVDLFAEGVDLRIEAGAGAGKTATLVALAKAQGDRRGAYLAFNKALTVEASKRMPANIEARTVHSFAHGAVMAARPELKARLARSERIDRKREAKLLGLSPVTIDAPMGRKTLAIGYLAGYVMQGIRNFCQSDDPEPLAAHLPTVEGIDEPTVYGHRGRNNWTLAEGHVKAMRLAWEDLTAATGVLRFEHAHYLKLWELGEPRIPADFLLLDEAQDLSAVMRSVILAQRDCYGTQLCFVGDPAQAIYGFTGATDAMSYLEGNRATLSKSFRFGPEVARVANRLLDLLDESDLRIVGHDPVPSVIGPVDEPDCILTRTNAKAVSLALSLMAQGKRVAIADSLKKQVIAFAQAAQALMAGKWTGHPELAPFSTWDEVERFVAEDPAGSELALMVNLVNEFGADVIVAELSQTVKPKDADVELSTAHTSKGREWDKVRIADDFPQRDKEGFPPDLAPEELRLLYVAVTRAKLALDVTLVDWIDDMEAA